MPIAHRLLTKGKFTDVYRILAATDNKFCEPLFSDQPIHELYIRRVNEMKKRDSKTQFASKMQETNSGWSKQDEGIVMKSLPEFDELNVKEFSLGVFGFNTALKYLNTSNTITFWKHEKLTNTVKVTGLTSRYSGQSKSRTVYFSFPKTKKKNENPLQNLNICCTCKAGMRTLGTCAHGLAILRYCALKLQNTSLKHITSNTSFENSVFESLHIITTKKRKKTHKYKRKIKKRKICKQNANSRSTETETETETDLTTTESESESNYSTQTNTETDDEICNQKNLQTNKNHKINNESTNNDLQNVFPLNNLSNTLCHINASVNLLLQSCTINDIINAYAQSKKSKYKKIINEIQSIKQKKNKSAKNVCDLLQISTFKQQDARESLSMILDTIDRANAELNNSVPNFKLRMQHKKNDNDWNYPYYVDKIQIPMDCKRQYLKSSIQNYFNCKHKVSDSKETLTYKLLDLPYFLFVSLDWRLVNEKMPDKVKQQIVSLEQEKLRLQNEIDVIDTANLILQKGKTKRKQKAKSNVALTMKRNKINTEILTLQSQMYFTKMNDICNFCETMDLRINKLHKKYMFLGTVCHKGDIDCSFGACVLCYLVI